MEDEIVVRSLAINVAANTNLPGVRGPIYPDGSFLYLPIPEREPTVGSVPTYSDLLDRLPPLPFEFPSSARDRRVHLDPEFADYPFCERYTYGDEHDLKARPIAELDPGDWLLFYATLTRHDPPAGIATGEPVEWVSDDWGAYLIGAFEVDRIHTGEEYAALPTADREPLSNNAHVKRDPIDAKIFVVGTDRSRLFDRAIPLSDPRDGTTANRIVTDLSNDSGKGPWWRRRLWFDDRETATLERLFDREVAIETVL